VEHLPFEQVNYWPELVSLIKDARKICASTLGLCWAGFALAYLAGVDKQPFARKLFGVYPMRSLVPGHPLMGTQDDRFYCPQSRHAGLPDDAMESAQRQGRLRLLAHGEQVGYSIFETPDQRQLMHLGHPEYNVGRILGEMERDRLELGSDPAQLYRAVGCEHCNMTGYRGRTGIYELIEIDEPLREAIHAGEGEQALLRIARQRSPGINNDGRRRILDGQTSLEEVLRVTAVN